jgi:cyclohexanone monooxygenase
MGVAWHRGGPLITLEISDSQSDADANRRLADYINARIRQRVHDGTVADLLTAKNQILGVRRVIIETGYYEAFNQENVTLVDVSRAPIEVGPTGIRTGGKDYELDMLILATGFDTGTGALLKIDLTGRSGRRIGEKWADGPCTYLGLMVSDFPNMFLFYGPGSPSLRANAALCIEQQVDWACDLVQWMQGRGVTAVAPAAQAEAAWTAHVAETADATLLTKADSQYVGANVPGKPRVYLCYVGGLGRYVQMCADVARNDYEGCVLTGNGTAPPTAHVWSGPPAESPPPTGSPVI